MDLCPLASRILVLVELACMLTAVRFGEVCPSLIPCHKECHGISWVAMGKVGKFANRGGPLGPDAARVRRENQHLGMSDNRHTTSSERTGPKRPIRHPGGLISWHSSNRQLRITQESRLFAEKSTHQRVNRTTAAASRRPPAPPLAQKIPATAGKWLDQAATAPATGPRSGAIPGQTSPIPCQSQLFPDRPQASCAIKSRAICR